MAKKTKKKEKYITERISKKGTHSFEICIRRNEQTFRKSILISDFDSPSQALQYACQIRDETLHKISQNYTVSNFPTVSQLYEDTFKMFPVSMKTKKKHDIFYKYGIERYGDMPINKVKPSHIQESINQYAKTQTKRQVNGLLAVWRRIYKTCAMKNVAIYDATVAVRLPVCAVETHRKKEVSASDLEKFCEALLEYNSTSVKGSYRSRAVYFAIRIMQYLGLRPSETFALLKSDIHLAEGFVSITKASRSTEDSMLALSRTKTEKSVRNVPIPPQLRPILEECLQWSRHDILLSDYFGNLLSIDDVGTLIRNVRIKAGVEFTLYALRHEFSSDLLSQGTPLPVLRDLMGHVSGSMSLDYALSNERDRIEAISNRKFS